MKEVFIVYKTDAVHSYASRDLLGIALNSSPIDICLTQAEKEGETISAEQIWNLENLKQTQGYSGEGEFHFESIEVDVLL